MDKALPKIKQSLKGKNPSLTDDALTERAQKIMGDTWYNKMSGGERNKIQKQYEGEAYSRADFEKYDAFVSALEAMQASYESELQAALTTVRADDFGDLSQTDNIDQLDIPQDVGQDDGDIVPPPAPIEGAAVPVMDQMNRSEAGQNVQAPVQQGLVQQQPDVSVGGGGKDPDAQDSVPMSAYQAAQFMSVPQYKFQYVAAPKPGFDGEGPIIIKAIVLEEGTNVNNWRVVATEFDKVAAQYKQGRQLRLNHDKTVESVIGKSFNGKVIEGKDIPGYLGSDMNGIVFDGKYVVAEFEANPRDPQVRTNILQGYVETGSIGLDAEAFCDTCGKQLTANKQGDMERACKHIDSPVSLRNVDVKEYSYVAEPAFEHTKAYPSFSAAVESSLRKTSSSEDQMSADQKILAQASKVSTQAAKKADADAEGDGKVNPVTMDGEAYADALLKQYKQGLADAARFRAGDGTAKKGDADASAEGEGEGEAEAKASATASRKVKTDQVARVDNQNKTPVTAPASNGRFGAKASEDMLQRIYHPTAWHAAQNPGFMEIFKYVADARGAPQGLKAKIEGASQ